MNEKQFQRLLSRIFDDLEANLRYSDDLKEALANTSWKLWQCGFSEERETDVKE